MTPQYSDLEVPDKKRRSSSARISGDEAMFFLELSESFFEMTGFTRLEIEILFDNQLSNMISGIDTGALYDSMIRQLDLYGSAELTFFLSCKDGLEFPVLMLVHPGERSTYFCLFSDLTPYHKYEEQCKLIQRESDAVSNGIPGGMVKFLCDEKFSVLYANLNSFRLSGYNKNEYLETFENCFLKLLLPEDAAALKAQIAEHCPKKEPVNGELRIRHKDGSTRWISYYGNYFGMQSGFPVYLCIILDINAHKLDSLQMLQTKQTLEQITTSVECGIVQYSIHPNLQIIYANDAFYEICGYSKADFQAKDSEHLPSLQMIHPDLQNIRKLRETGSVTLRYKITRKDGSPAWLQMNAALIQDANGQEIIQAVITDITDMHQIQEELEREKERYRIILAATKSITFNYNIPNDLMQIFEQADSTQGTVSRKIEFPHYLDYLPKSTLIHPDDLPKLMPIYRGEAFDSIEVRMEKPGFPKEQYYWFLLQGALIRDKNNKPLEIVGIMREIDEQKKAEARLITKAQQDSLTRLYNKATVQSLVENALEESDPSEIHAMMIVDIDNFKQVNDTLGHWLGDTVLTDVATNLKKLFRTSDIVGRIGGDEFAIFLKNIGSPVIARKKAEAVCEMFRNIYIGENSSYKISGSVGIALCPQHGKTYSQLFKNADAALYTAKRKGKNNYRFYSTTPLVQGWEAEWTVTGTIDDPARIRNSLVAEISEMLLEAKNIELAVSMVLRMLVNRLDISRASIYDLSPDDTILTNTFEWHKKDLVSLISQKTAPPSEQHIPYRKLFDTEGILDCSNIELLADKHPEFYEFLKNQGAHSVLAFYLTEEHMPSSVYIFNDHSKIRRWTPEETETLRLVCKTVSTYLMKLKIQDHYRQGQILLKALSAHSEIKGFLVDPDQHALYCGKGFSLTEALQKNDQGKCHEVLYGRNRPCPNCPAAEAKRKKDAVKFTRKLPGIEKPQSGTVCPIVWNGKDMLLFCIDPSGKAPFSRKD